MAGQDPPHDLVVGRNGGATGQYLDFASLWPLYGVAAPRASTASCSGRHSPRPLGEQHSGAA